AYDPLTKEIIDPAGGKKDIRAKNIAAVGSPDACFLADPLRLIRAVRFSANLDFKIEEKTALAIKKFAAEITKASPERIRDELISIFTGPNPARGLELLDETGLLEYVLPDAARMKGVPQPAQFHPEGDVFSHTLLMLKQLKQPSVVLAFACLLHDIGKPDTFQITDRIRFSGHDKTGAKIADKILRELCFPNADRENIVACVDNHMRMMEAPRMRQATLKRLLARPTFSEELKLHYIDCLASHKDLSVWRFLKRKHTRFRSGPVIPKPLLNGDELKKMGFTPGPIFGRIHSGMVDLQLEGKIKNKSQAKKWVREKFARRETSG
ncbi:MAG: HDIG domain-containing metalloprotein, partial [Candidatus Omnitrophota bacterium]